jgi:hypothetical protein
MTTIVIHGTQTHRSPVHSTWWWNSWHAGGFLEAVGEGMNRVSGLHDLWRVNGAYVPEVPELTAKKSFWSFSLSARSLAQHKGHFYWGGAAMGIARDAGSDLLVAYLNKIRELTRERLRIIAHSHGCNIVKLASDSPNLSPDIHIESAAFLACPHFFTPNAVDEYRVTYKLDPRRFGRILNLYCPSDSVQVNIASHLSGQALSASIAEIQCPTAYRVEQDPDAQHLYENVEVEVAGDCSGTQAHTVMHGALVGEPVGVWLDGGGTFNQVLSKFFSGTLPPVPAKDDGA